LQARSAYYLDQSWEKYHNLHMDEEYTHIEYKEELRENFTKNYLEIKYNAKENEFIEIYFYNSDYGKIKYINGNKEMHTWETEDQAIKNSSLGRHFTQVCLNGVSTDMDTENKIIKENVEYLKTQKIDNATIKIINEAIRLIKKCATQSGGSSFNAG
jgi:hypothetical protein